MLCVFFYLFLFALVYNAVLIYVHHLLLGLHRSTPLELGLSAEILILSPGIGHMYVLWYPNSLVECTFPKPLTIGCVPTYFGRREVTNCLLNETTENILLW